MSNYELGPWMHTASEVRKTQVLGDDRVIEQVRDTAISSPEIMNGFRLGREISLLAPSETALVAWRLREIVGSWHGPAALGGGAIDGCWAPPFGSRGTRGAAGQRRILAGERGLERFHPSGEGDGRGGQLRGFEGAVTFAELNGFFREDLKKWST